MDLPKISIIVPIYNAEKYIEKCVRSLFEQTFSFIEYIFVDDCSPDNSIEIIKSVLKDYPRRQEQCIFIYLCESCGPATARNVGLEKANGEYIYFCDADDWLDLTMMTKMYSLAVVQCADIVVCDFYIVAAVNHKKYCRVTSWTSDKKESIYNYIKKEYTVVWNLLIQNELYKNNNIAFIPGYSYSEDLNLSVKLFYKAKKVVNIHEALYYYNRINENSIVSRLDEKKLSDERIMCMELLKWLYKEGADFSNVLYWRILKGKQEMLLSTDTYKTFLNTVPESNRYILSCPDLNVKLKIMGWCLVHHLSFISKFLLFIRKCRLLFVVTKS